MARNGEVNKKFGIYRTLCCDSEIVIIDGATFPDCPKHKNLTTEWKPITDSRDGVIHISEYKKSRLPAA